MCENASCPILSPGDCRLTRVLLDPCCRTLCLNTEWRERNSLAGFLTNFTRSLLGWDAHDSSAPVGPSFLGAGQVAPVRRFVVNNSTLRFPVRQMVEISHSRSAALPHEIFSSKNWDDDQDSGGSDAGVGGGSYEAVIIGITLLILCLLVIAIIFVMALFRLRKVRTINWIRRSPTHVPEVLHETELHSTAINVAYITDPPPAYQQLKPVCSDPPPSYDQLMQAANGPVDPQLSTSGSSMVPQTDVISSGVILHVPATMGLEER